MSERKCPECNGVMELGFVGDFTHSHFFQTKWQRGVPKRMPMSWLWQWGWPLQPEPFLMIDITTYRCVDCGALRSYALKNETKAVEKELR